MTIPATVPLSPQDVCPVLTGTTVPTVTLRTADGDAFDLNKAVSQQPSCSFFIGAVGDRTAISSWSNCERSNLS
jgi:hypothetical protein